MWYIHYISMAFASRQRHGHLCICGCTPVVLQRFVLGGSACVNWFAGGLQSKQSAAVCDADNRMSASCSSHRGWFAVDFLSTFPLWAVVLGCLDGSGYDTATYRYWALLQLLAMACPSLFPPCFLGYHSHPGLVSSLLQLLMLLAAVSHSFADNPVSLALTAVPPEMNMLT